MKDLRKVDLIMIKLIYTAKTTDTKKETQVINELLPLEKETSNVSTLDEPVHTIDWFDKLNNIAIDIFQYCGSYDAAYQYLDSIIKNLN